MYAVGGPFGPLNTIGQSMVPPDMYLPFAAEFTI